jgi:hypothetical protein
MAKPIARSIDEAKKLGFRPTTRSVAEIRALVHKNLTAAASDAFQKDCLTTAPGEPCLQTDCGDDGKMYLCFCKGSSCDDCHEYDCR